MEGLLGVHHLAEVFPASDECHAEVLDPRQQTDVRYDSYVELEAWVALALHLDVLLLLTWSVRAEVNVDRVVGCDFRSDAFSEVDLLPVVCEEDHRDQLAAY